MKHRYMLFALPGEWLDNCENIAEMHVKQKYLSKAANIAQLALVLKIISLQIFKNCKNYISLKIKSFINTVINILK